MLYNIYDNIRRFLLPPLCAYCRKFMQDYTILCSKCFDRIRPVVSVKLEVNASYDLKVYAIGNYEEPLKTLILSKNNPDSTYIKLLAKLICKNKNFKTVNFDYVVPVPLHWTRHIYRGYNQAQILAEEISRLTNKPIFNYLERTKKTVFQSTLSPDERKKNVSKAFSLNSKINKVLYQNKKFLLVDDLMTTGSTLQSMAKVLVELKPGAMHAIVACRVSNKK